MAFPRQPLLFTETVPHNAYETVEGNQKTILQSNMAAWMDVYRVRPQQIPILQNVGYIIYK